MRVFILGILMLFGGMLTAQTCAYPFHSTDPEDHWLSCTLAPNPNPERGSTHWILYDLGEVRQVSTSRFWNYNVPGETTKGMKRVSVDYSVDGEKWLEGAVFTLAQAPGSGEYAGEKGPKLVGVEARYLLISALESWGDSCVGLAEVRFDLLEKTEEIEAPIVPDKVLVYPNPTQERLFFQTDLAIEKLVILSTSGAVVARMPFSPELDVSYLPTGLYYLQFIQENGEVSASTFLKQYP